MHYPHNEYKVLILSDEKPTWQSFDEYGNKDFYDYSNYYQNVEAYTLHHPSPQAISTIEQDLKPINWDTFLKTQKHVFILMIWQNNMAVIQFH